MRRSFFLPALGFVFLLAGLAQLDARQARRDESALKESLASYADWLGPEPPRGNALDVTERWIAAPSSMDVESQVSYELARRWFGPADPANAAMVNGVAWYLQSRVGERLFDFAFLTEGCCLDSTAFLGGAVPWSFARLPLTRWSGGLGRSLPAGRRLPASVDAPAIRAALAFGTLERYLTWPVLQSALREWAQQARSKKLSPADIQQLTESATGEDLGWFFSAAFDPARRFDYAIDAFTTEGKTTRVTVVRRGDAMFTGRTAQPDGPFESGDAMELRVTFADGQQITERWDGRQASKVFEFDSPSPAVEAWLDPNQILLLDENYLDNRRMITPSHNIAVAKWTARWVMWLQNAMLTCGALL